MWLETLILDNRALYDKSLESNNMSYSVFITCLNSDQQRCVVNKADKVTFLRVWCSDFQPCFQTAVIWEDIRKPDAWP